MQGFKISLLNEIKLGKSKFCDSLIKHPTLSDEAFLENLYEKFFELSKKRKVKTEKEALEFAKKAGSWNESLESEIVKLNSFCSRLQETLDKTAFIGSQKEALEKDIVKNKEKIRALESRRFSAIGKTAESWANKMSSERYIFSLFFKDQNLAEQKWSDSEVEYIEEGGVSAAFSNFISFREAFSDENLKTLAVSPFCQNLYECCDDAFSFYGKSILDLTQYQQKLFLYLKNYNNIIGMLSGKVSQDKLSDWRELEKWAKSSEKAREQIEGSWSKNKSSDLSRDAIRAAAKKDNSTRLKNATNMKELLS
jgi:hypothetical protein